MSVTPRFGADIRDFAHAADCRRANCDSRVSRTGVIAALREGVILQLHGAGREGTIR